jgi:hypothetical protein
LSPQPVDEEFMMDFL